MAKHQNTCCNYPYFKFHNTTNYHYVEILDHLPTSSFQRSCWMTPSSIVTSASPNLKAKLNVPNILPCINFDEIMINQGKKCTILPAYDHQIIRWLLHDCNLGPRRVCMLLQKIRGWICCCPQCAIIALL